MRLRMIPVRPTLLLNETLKMTVLYAATLPRVDQWHLCMTMKKAVKKAAYLRLDLPAYLFQRRAVLIGSFASGEPDKLILLSI